MHHVPNAVLGVGLALLLTACGGGPGAAAVVPVVEVVEDVAYYYACGDEVLTLPDGRQFFPFEDQATVDTSRYDPGSPGAIASVGALTLAVAPPRPGDDIGTLFIHEDGTARFMSDLGTVAWLDDTPRTYPWVC